MFLNYNLNVYAKALSVVLLSDNGYSIEYPIIVRRTICKLKEFRHKVTELMRK